jgi:hypothetical protein
MTNGQLFALDIIAIGAFIIFIHFAKHWEI